MNNNWLFDYNDKVLYEVSDKIELLRSFFEVFNSRVLLNIIKHELIHYALFEKYGTGCNDGDELFESECKRLGIEWEITNLPDIINSLTCLVLAIKS